MKPEFKIPEECSITCNTNDERVVFTTLKMGTATLHQIDRNFGDVFHDTFSRFFFNTKLYLANNCDIKKIENPDMEKYISAFNKEDGRQIVFFLRNPHKALVAGVLTVFGRELGVLKEGAKVIPELHNELEKISGDIGKDMFPQFDENLFESFLRFSLKNYPYIFLSNSHINHNYYQQLLSLLVYIKLNHSYLLSRISLLDLDNYNTDPGTLEYLEKKKLIINQFGTYKVNSLADYRIRTEKVLFNDIFFNNSAYLLIRGYNTLSYATIREVFGDKFFTLNPKSLEKDSYI